MGGGVGRGGGMLPNKSATEVYEQATNCPVAGGTGRIWSEYARFLEERGRPRTAQNLYLRALVGTGGGGGEDGGGGPRVTDPSDRAALWDGFLRMMRTLRKNPDLTLDELKSAARREHLGGGGGADRAASDGVGSMSDLRVSSPAAAGIVGLAKDEEDDASRPAKRSRWDARAPAPTAAVGAGGIDTIARILLASSRNVPPEIEMLWFARDGGGIPSRPEPALFAASPPKLGDPSGKDLLGNETALRILRMLTETTHDGRRLGSAVLELCHACWMMTALKEEEVARAQESIEKKIIADKEALQSDLDTRAAVAGGALAAVQQANEKEMSLFDAQSEAQRNQVLSSIAWEFRKLLYTQQIMLTNAKIPGFDGPTVDSAAIALQSRVCSVMHSAFYLRARVGETSHVNMLNKQLESLEKFIRTTVKTEPVDQQSNHAPIPLQQQPLIFQQPMMPPMFSQPPMMYSGQSQQQPMIYQPIPMGFQQFHQGHPMMQPAQQFLGQLNTQNNLS
ncbi:hypothetical protein ACHAW5_008185 [Stephanodiscus triporus]|uniref:Uncharacterized protein n=1 Tax=Stephanodiscus triporus TaxID=2934178 RepID=A0ABD3NGN3_9STRA